MNYHRRFNADGTYELICTRCFLTLGTFHSVSASREIESHHVCGGFHLTGRAEQPAGGTVAQAGSPATQSREAPTHRVEDEAIPHIPFAFLFVAFFLYALPTVAEFLAAQHINPWFASILPGNLTGCVCLATIFKMRRTGLLLYLALSVAQACLYASHLVSATTLIWIADLVPTVVVGSVIARARETYPVDDFVRM